MSLRFSPYNPILFGVLDGAEINGEYGKIFSVSDHVLFECFHSPCMRPGNMSLIDDKTGDVVFPLSWNTLQLNDSDCVSFYELRNIMPGQYRIVFDDFKSESFSIIADDDVIDATALIQYSQSNNRNRKDIYANIGKIRRFFDLRLPGGFLDRDWSFGVDNEVFLTDKSDQVELYSVDTTDKILTIGPTSGLPLHIGEMINRILSCDLVYVDGVRYTRVNDSAPEAVQVEPDKDLFIFKQSLRQSLILNAEFERLNQLSLRRAPHRLRRIDNKLRKV